MKDAGHGPEAIAIYRRVLEDAAKRGYFTEPRLQLAYFGLAETERGQNDIRGAADSYAKAAAQPDCSDWMRKRAALNAGEMLDKQGQRDQAMAYYRQAAAGGRRSIAGCGCAQVYEAKPVHGGLEPGSAEFASAEGNPAAQRCV